MTVAGRTFDSGLSGSSASTFRLTLAVIGLYAVAALALVPVATNPGPEIPGITALFVGVVFVTELCTSFLLFLRFREEPRWSLLILGCAYLFSALMVVPHLLTFPGAVLPGRPLIQASLQSPGWIFVTWINGYALLTLAAVLLEMRAGSRTRPEDVDRATLAGVGAIVVVVFGLAFLAIALVDRLPPVMGGTNWTAVNRIMIIIALAMLAGAIAIILLRLRSGLFLWLSLALTAMAFANILSEAGGARYTVGWSFGRLSWMISACALFVYFMDQFARQRGLLRKSEQQFELLVQGVRDYAIFMLDPGGRVSSWNAGAQHIKGYSAEEIVGLHFSKFYTTEDRESGLPAHALREAETKGKFENQGWRIRKDGTRFWASVVVEAIRDQTGKLIGFAKVTRDITEQRRTQELLEQSRDRLFQSQKMEAVGQLTGGVAHDFNNLLTIIMGNLDIAKRHVGSLTGGVAEQLTRVIGNARTGAERAAVLTQRLLAFSRRQPLSPKSLDLNRFIAGSVEFLQRSLGETIQIEAVGGAGLWPVEADRHQLEASLLNLAVNARDAMPNGGKLTIETSNAFLDEEYCRGNPEVATGQYVLVSVSDTGVGMKPDIASRAFEPFFTTKGVGQGTGLGLSQVYGFVKQSGGHVKIYSEAGHGTTVKIYLPRLVGGGHSIENEPSRTLHKSLGETILVVEDDADVRAYIVEVLRDLDYDVLEAAEAMAALALVEQRNGRIDLLLSDVVLPGLNGRELAQQIQARWPATKVLYMTGYSRNAIAHQGRLDPGVEVIQKPIVQTDLADRIRNLLDASGSAAKPPFPA